MRATLMGLTIAVAIAQAAQACPSSDFYANLLLRALPAAAEGEPVVARVEVVAVLLDGMVASTRARVRVIEATRGVERGRMLEVRTQENHMCVSRFSQRSVRQRGYIAGSIDASGVFRGSWRMGRRVD